jgi:trk system potassium uptake protein TrkH
MNYKMVLYTIGNILKVIAGFILLPMIVSFIYKDSTWWCFLTTAGIVLLVGFLFANKKPKNTLFYSKEGYVIVGLSWILISLFGCLPFIFSREIPSFIDAFFETVSGFTTTGASILEADVLDNMSKSMIFYRSLTHWIGGMGVLVFILAILPNTSDGQNIYILKAESPGPQVGKLVSKVKLTARILYLIYLGMTILEFGFLLLGKMSIFDALTTSLATAGTGGFGITSASIACYSSYCQIVIGVFMLLFGINFNIYYLLLIGKAKQALKSEEMWWYLGIVFVSVVSITLNIYFTLGGNILTILKDSFFQVSSIITTTGFSSVDFTLWPSFSQFILFLLMFCGACAGSTGGGIKVSRIVIMIKSMKREMNKLIHPNSVSNIRFEYQKVDEDTSRSVNIYFGLILLTIGGCVLILSLDQFDFITNVTATVSCINNIGPGLGSSVGPSGSYHAFNWISKLTLIFSMLIGRLEVFPIMMLFNYKVWKKH